ncbi:retinol-binding protein pinta-like isoform X2 [Homalodisca vitripennis]|uniref:retinol-binding protein pinta-like isoform X2 n=1 Tax=Homalodisca vitripennis TaxID=197043 RepID=UPI001EE9BFEC|nr:retinol-binding protein pinta-like isoform X2 [Homalodisca vitripennis]
MSLAPVTEEQRRCIEADINYDEDQMKKKIIQVKDWMKQQPHLPQVPDTIAEKKIRSCLLGTKLSTEITKHKIDTFYSMRQQLPEIFLNRDPTQKDIRESVDVIRFFPSAELTPDGVRVCIMSFNGEKGKKFVTKDLKALYRRILAITDARIQQDEICRGDYLVIDCKGFYSSHLTELPWTLILKFASLTQEGLPVRVKGIFAINAPGYVEAASNILKPVFRRKIQNRIQIFHGDHKNLYKYIPKRILPSDFGGDAPSVEESSREWQKTIESMYDFLIEDEKRITDESKRPTESRNDCGQIFGVNGTFNKLTID